MDVCSSNCFANGSANGLSTVTPPVFPSRDDRDRERHQKHDSA